MYLPKILPFHIFSSPTPRTPILLATICFRHGILQNWLDGWGYLKQEITSFLPCRILRDAFRGLFDLGKRFGESALRSLKVSYSLEHINVQ